MTRVKDKLRTYADSSLSDTGEAHGAMNKISVQVELELTETQKLSDMLVTEFSSRSYFCCPVSIVPSYNHHKF